MLYTTRILFPVFVVSMLAACGGNDSATPPTRVEGQENPPTLSAGSDQQAAERSTIELRATVQNTDQNSVVAYAWLPASEETVFFGEAGRSDESVLNLQLPQVNNDTPVEFIVQAQLSNGNVLEDRVQITIQNTFDNALPVVTTTASPIGLDNRLPMDSRIGTQADTVQSEVSIRSTQAMDPLQDMSFELFSSQSGPRSNQEQRYLPLQTQTGKNGRFTVTPSDGKNWYFVRVKRGDRIVAVSAPIWIFKGSEPLPECAAS